MSCIAHLFSKEIDVANTPGTRCIPQDLTCTAFHEARVLTLRASLIDDRNRIEAVSGPSAIRANSTEMAG